MSDEDFMLYWGALNHFLHGARGASFPDELEVVQLRGFLAEVNQRGALGQFILPALGTC